MSPPENEATCAYADCEETATVALRFGDGSSPVKQTLVAYCDQHAAIVRRRFWTCDERSARS